MDPVGHSAQGCMWGALGTVFLRETFYLQSLCHLVSQENILTHFASLLPLKGEPGRNGSPGEVGFSGSPVSLFGSTQSTHVGLPLTAHVTQVPAERAFRRDDGELTPTLPALGAGKDGLGGTGHSSSAPRSAFIALTFSFCVAPMLEPSAGERTP